MDVKRLPWPTQSSDLNLIHHLWYKLQQCLRTREPCPKSTADLTRFLQQEWTQIPIAVYQNLVLSMSRSLQLQHMGTIPLSKYIFFSDCTITSCCPVHCCRVVYILTLFFQCIILASKIRFLDNCLKNF